MKNFHISTHWKKFRVSLALHYRLLRSTRCYDKSWIKLFSSLVKKNSTRSSFRCVFVCARLGWAFVRVESSTQIHKFMLMHNELLSEFINICERTQCIFSIRLHTTYTCYASWEQLGRSMSNNEIILTRKTLEQERKLLQMQNLCSIRSFLCFHIYQPLHQLWTRTEWTRQSSQSN